ncbi:MAG: GAF domain-containing protein, partial [Rickettsiales bacterium]|nr:GAF domain-containing protein [Rickettsiales bacterium]
MDNEFLLHVWGVRGSIPTPGMDRAAFGGQTSCVELRVGGQRIILDAGTGCLSVPRDFAQADLLLSHTHIDHILGLPFLLPALKTGTKLSLWAGHLKPQTALRPVVERLMSGPIFPLTLENAKADISFHDFTAGEAIVTPDWEKAGIRVETLLLSHPDRATGYRISYGGKRVCYLTDYEHDSDAPAADMVAFVKDADVLLCDSTYADEAFEAHRGWGHSTWQQGLRLAEAAGVKRFFAFHHDPMADDATLSARSHALSARKSGSVFAREGMRYDVLKDALHMPEPQGAQLPLVEKLTEIGMALSAEDNLDRLLEIILVEAQKIAHADGGTLYYRQEDMLEFAIVRNDSLGMAFGGTAAQKPPIAPLPLYDEKSPHASARTLAAYAVQTKQPVNIADAYATGEFDFEGAKLFDRQHGYRTQSVLAIPMLTHAKEVLGCLQLVNARDAHSGALVPFSQQTQKLVQSLASQAAIILHNKTLLAEQKNLLESFIRMIAQAIDAKSPYTGAHCERVPMLTNMLAEAACAASDGPMREFSLTPEEKYELHIAGWMHDCGKV